VWPFAALYVGYTSPNFVINVVILEKKKINLKFWHYFKNIFHLFFTTNEMEIIPSDDILHFAT
jgi:hypothetical protein